MTQGKPALSAPDCTSISSDAHKALLSIRTTRNLSMSQQEPAPPQLLF
ncbi:baseplate wedge initiator [Salmonella phage 18-India]|nr:baseplate wedge initiator [Salmonella phage 18-India]